jgi:hypothetical protein
MSAAPKSEPSATFSLVTSPTVNLGADILSMRRALIQSYLSTVVYHGARFAISLERGGLSPRGILIF